MCGASAPFVALLWLQLGQVGLLYVRYDVRMLVHVWQHWLPQHSIVAAVMVEQL